MLYILLAKIIAMIVLWIVSAILGILVKIFTKKEDSLAAKRVVAYASVASLIPPVSLSGLIRNIVSIILWVIGVSKQYKLSIEKSVVIVIAPVIILIILILIVTVLLYYSGGITDVQLFYNYFLKI